MDGGSAINSNSDGGSLGTKGCSTCFNISCCFCCAAAVTVSLEIAAGRPPGSCPNKKISFNILKCSKCDIY